MQRGKKIVVSIMLLFAVAFLADSWIVQAKTSPDYGGVAYAVSMMVKGRQVFRFDTFGGQAFWGDTLRLHEAVAKLSPAAALGLGLKVDLDALPQDLRGNLEGGGVNFDDPAVFAEWLRLRAIVGMTGFFDDEGRLSSVGIQCALCHSTVDGAFNPGIGRQRDGWANRDLNIGALIALAPDLQFFVSLLGTVDPTVNEAKVRTILKSWGPGKYDLALLLDGKAFRPDGKPAAVLIPPIFDLAGASPHSGTGLGGMLLCNALAANVAIGGKGVFSDPRLYNPEQFPIAATFGASNTRDTPDLVTGKLRALHLYQLSLPPPRPPAGSFDPVAAARGKELFNGKAECANCHVPPLYREPGWGMHTPEEIGIDAFQANRTPDRRYRTAPLRGLWTHAKGGFFHDGRFPTLLDVVNHYDRHFGLVLTGEEKRSLVEFLKSL